MKEQSVSLSDFFNFSCSVIKKEQNAYDENK